MRKGFTLLELLIVVVILGILALIAAPALLNAADEAKEGAVKANVSAASSSVVSRFALKGDEDPTDIASAVITALMANNTTKNPYGSTAPAAFSGTAGKGVVTIVGDDTANTVTITGYGKDGATALVTKVITPPADNN